MTRLRAIVVDDEPLAREGLASALRDLDVDVVATCADGFVACDAIARERPELLMLDVEMPELDGFAVLERLEPEDLPPAIIFVTAYDAHAVRAFEAHALDYVLKPAAPERLRAAVDRARHRVTEARALQAAMTGDVAPPEVSSLRAEDGYLATLLLRERGSTVVLPVRELDWIEADTYYVRLHTADGSRPRLLRERMSVLEARLDPAQFFRTHRSAIVRLDRVREVRTISRYEHAVVLTTGVRVRLSRDRRAKLESALRVLPATDQGVART